jgi:transposase
MRKSYPTNLTDSEWRSLKSHLPTPQKRGRPRIHGFREIMDAIFYVLKSGCQWRLLPCDFPPWETVYHYFRRWSLDGTWERVHHTIREHLRASLGRTPQPSAAIVVDSQSAKTSGVGGEARGYDRRAKQVRGRKRHILVDTEGFVLKVKVHSANVPDQDGIRLLLERRIRARSPPAPLSPVARRRLPRTGQGVGRKRTRLERRGRAQASEARPGEDSQDLGGGMGQRGQKDRLAEAHAAEGLSGLAEEVGGGKDVRLALPQSPHEPMDYERLCATGEAFVYVAMTRLMVRRLARA